MKPLLLSYVSSLVSLAVLDGIWLSLIAKPFYTKSLQHLLAPSPRWLPVILFYLCYAAGLSLLVVLPQIKAHASPITVFGYGALLGFIAYAAYDFTNLATLNRWPVGMSIIDLAWGTSLTSVVCLVAFLLVRRFGS